jgi:HEPN domain-containing protein
LNTNFKHGDGEINLFQLAVDGFLAGFVDLATNKTLNALWQAVLASKPQKNTPKALVFCMTRYTEFNNAMNKALDLLLTEAQNILKILSPHGLELVAFPFKGVAYNYAKLYSDKNFTNQTLGLQIAFRGQTLERPQLYLNEARQSAIGLALYLGARLACAPQTTPHLKLLVLDDVLVGLDHSNRLPVLNVLVELFPTWQVVLLTHDKGWFDLARQRLPSTDWTQYEIYEGDLTATAPMPIVRRTLKRPALALLQKARVLLTQGYLEAAANYVRQAFETGIRAACELKSIKLPYKQDVAQDFLNGLKTWPGNATVPKTDWDAALHKLELMKDVVMNPYSHPGAPNIPRQEIVDAADAVEIFLELVRKK